MPAPFGPMIRRRSPGRTASVDVVRRRQAAEGLLQAVISSARSAPEAPPQPLHARHHALGHEHDDEHEDEPEQHVPALDVGRDVVLEDHHDRRADDRPGERARAAGDHREQALGGVGERERDRVDVLVVVDEEQPRHRAPEAGVDERDPADQPDVVAERAMRRGWSRVPLQRGAERRGDEARHQPDRDRGHDQARSSRTRRRVDRRPNGAGRSGRAGRCRRRSPTPSGRPCPRAPATARASASGSRARSRAARSGRSTPAISVVPSSASGAASQWPRPSLRNTSADR